VNQTAQYCEGNWASWDPKITTLPGLYLVGAPYGQAVHAALGLLRPQAAAAARSTSVLRSLNVLFAAAFFAVFQQLYRCLHTHKSPEYATLMVGPFSSCMRWPMLALWLAGRPHTLTLLQALVALLLPTHFFYAFLYYTDVGAVTLVLACYLVSTPGLLAWLLHIRHKAHQCS
jgi:alpha-1,2-glucosyltransferase